MFLVTIFIKKKIPSFTIILYIGLFKGSFFIFYLPISVKTFNRKHLIVKCIFKKIFLKMQIQLNESKIATSENEK